jgi:hypothetical protein
MHCWVMGAQMVPRMYPYQLQNNMLQWLFSREQRVLHSTLAGRNKGMQGRFF